LPLHWLKATTQGQDQATSDIPVIQQPVINRGEARFTDVDRPFTFLGIIIEILGIEEE
jgi:hypothetical protein